MTAKRFALAILFAALAGAPAWAQDAGMAAAASGFYTTYLVLPRTGGIPSVVSRARLQPLLSPRLTRLIADAAAAETRFHTRIKDSPPLIEGDLFTSLFEGADSFKLGACSGDAKQGRCAVQLHHQPLAGGKDQPADWTDNVLLVNSGSGWKVDDIAYKAGFAFGNTGLLSETLKVVISTAP